METILTADVLRGINQDLKVEFPIIKRSGPDVSKGFEKGSFSADVINSAVEKISTGIYEYRYNIALRYFPSDNKKFNEELFRMRDRLLYYYTLKEYLEIDGIILPIEDVEGVIVDEVLTISFSLTAFQQEAIKLNGGTEELIDELNWD